MKLKTTEICVANKKASPHPPQIAESVFEKGVKYPKFTSTGKNK